MYQSLLLARILLSVGIGLLIFSLVFGWVSFSVPDWLQFHEKSSLKTNINENISQDDKSNDLKQFGLWYKCVFSTSTNDFICTSWNDDAPSFVRVARVFIPFGLSLGCLSLLSAIIGFLSRRAFNTAVLFSALFAFLSFLFTTIGIVVFATESTVYVDRLRINNNDNPRRWGMWLQIPNLVFSFFASICFIVASIHNWCDYRNMKVSGILSHSFDKCGGSVCKAPSDSNMTSAVKPQYQYQDYPNGCYQINGLNNNQQNPMTYPPPPSYAANLNPAFQPTPSGLFGYSGSASPGMNRMYPHSNFDLYHPRHFMTENSEMDDLSRASRSRHRSRSHSRSRRHSDHRSNSRSPRESTTTADINPKQTQFFPVPAPYYQPTSQPIQPPVVSSHNPPMSYLLPQVKQQFIDENVQQTTKPTNILTYGPGQQQLLVSNPNQPIYTIAYRANNVGNVLASNMLTGSAAATYVTAAKNQIIEINSLDTNFENVDKDYQTICKLQKLKKMNINEAWAWRKL